MRYDAKSRRVRKTTPEVTHTFFYDGWNLIEERVAYTNGNNTTFRYYLGNLLGKSGPMCDLFRHRFSTKYCDIETGLYYYGYRTRCWWPA